MTKSKIPCSVITGATKGIGRAIASALAPRTSALVAIARNSTELEQLESEVASLASDCRFALIDGDVADPQTARRALDAADAMGGCGALVNAAGIFPPALLDAITPEHTRKVFGANFFGVLNFCQTFAPGMVERGKGQIVNLTSIAARSPTPGLSIYAASKGAVEAFSRSIAVELAPNVRVNCVSPGPTMTETVRELSKNDTTGAVEAVTRAIPIARYGKPAEVAEAVLFLVESKASKWMTGETLQINGGLLMA